MRHSIAFGILAIALAMTSIASAQTSPAPAAPAAPAGTDAAKNEARTHFEKGLSLFDEEAWDAALAEFLRSRELFPTRAATKDAAFCLRKLHRFDEALDMFEALLADFPNLPADDRAIADREIRALGGFVGRIDVRGGEPGATVVVDNRARGTMPSDAVRVAIGTHVIRVVKEGFVPFEAQVTVASGQTSTVPVKLARLIQGGRLKVVEQTGKVVNVLVDNVVVGKTPWEGTLPVGHHSVTLVGEDKLGTPPARAPVLLDEVTSLTLAVEELGARLRVEPSPAEARVAVDGVVVGRGLWEGRLRAGAHRIEVGADGFLPLSQDVSLVESDHQVIGVKLERDPRAALTFGEAEAARQQWLKRGGSTIAYELRAQGGFLLAPHQNNRSGPVVVSSQPDVGPFVQDATRRERTFGGGGAGGVGFRIAYMYMLLPDPATGSTWSAFRVGTGADANLGYWFSPTQIVRQTSSTTTTYEPGEWGAGFMFNVPVTLGYQLGIGSFNGTQWRGLALGVAYTPSLTVLAPKDLDGQAFLNPAAFEVSVDFLDRPVRAEGTARYGKVFAYVLPPVGDSWLVVSIGGGAVWY